MVASWTVNSRPYAGKIRQASLYLTIYTKYLGDLERTQLDETLRRHETPAHRRRLNQTAKPKHPPGPPMDLANMREQGITLLIAFCHNDACRHQALIDVSSYSAEISCIKKI
jgi:hypothetical protein